MAARRTVVRRGLVLGAHIGAWPAGILGSAFLVVAFVFMVGGRWGHVRSLLRMGSLAVVGSMAVGLLLGAAVGAVLAAVPRRLVARPPLRGLLAALTAGAPLVASAAAFLLGDGCTLGSYPLSSHLVTWSVPLVVALVAAARSGEVAGCGFGSE